MNTLYNLIGSLILFYSIIYSWSKLTNNKIQYKGIKFYVIWIFLSLFSIFNYFLVNKFIKISILTLVLMLCITILFKTNIYKSIITPIFDQIIIMISEAICILLLVFILNLDLNELKNQFLGTIVANTGTAIINIGIVSIPITCKIYNFIMSNINKLSRTFLMILSLIVICIANVLAMTTYYEVDFKILILINISFTLICAFIVFYSLKVQSNYNNVSSKYDIAINSLKDYDSMMTRYRIDNHENKNLLLTIRAMINNKEKNIPKFIDSIVKDKYTCNEQLMKKISIIPTGGLRATIYSEIIKMQNNNIDYYLDIDRKLKTVDLIEYDTKTIIDICKILGVFVDNAIEEVCKNKRRYIAISMYIEDNLFCVKVSNNYSGEIEIDRLYEEGYTTKGIGHGYGLPLVKKIIDSNNVFENRMEISEDIFSQILMVKHKKSSK